MAPPRPNRIPQILLFVFLIAAVGIAAYWNGLRAPFIWDDDPAIISNTTGRNLRARRISPTALASTRV